MKSLKLATVSRADLKVSIIGIVLQKVLMKRPAPYYPEKLKIMIMLKVVTPTSFGKNVPKTVSEGKTLSGF